MTLFVGVPNASYNHEVTPLLGDLIWVECLQIYLLLLVAHLHEAGILSSQERDIPTCLKHFW